MTEDIEKRKVNYLFTAMPNAMLYNLSGNALKLFGVLLRKESEWFAKCSINDGLFEVTFNDLKQCCNLTENTLKQHLELLFRNNIIYIKVGEHKNSRSIIGINWFRILIYENLPTALQTPIKMKNDECDDYTFNLEDSERHEQMLLEIKWFFNEKYHTLPQKSITKLSKNWKKCKIFDPFGDSLSVDIEEFNSFKNGHKDKKKESEKETKNIETEYIETRNMEKREKYQILQRTNSANGSVECCSVFDNLPF